MSENPEQRDPVVDNFVRSIQGDLDEAGTTTIKHINVNETPSDKLRLEVEKNSRGYNISVRVTSNDADELIDTALGILEETKSRLGVTDE